MQKILFLDRDGTLVLEPDDYQVDAVEKINYYPDVFRYLSRIVQEMDYELVMVTNQDGLGTSMFPEENFQRAHSAIMNAFKSQGIVFREVLIDRTFKHENAPTRKPNTGLLTHYLEGPYDLANSYVIGDRITDMGLAKNLGAQGIWLHTDPQLGADELADGESDLQSTIALRTQSWESIYRFLRNGSRAASVERRTRETAITVQLNLDGSGAYSHQTGIGFFDHMLDQLAKHAGIDLEIRAAGDLHIDEHHTIEDTAIALGEAFGRALGDKRGIERYGFFLLPMDESLAQAAVDFGGRPCLVWDARLKREKIGDFPTEMAYHFFKSFSDHARANIHIRVQGENDHHQVEAVFKAFARAVKMAIQRDPEREELPTTKGFLG